MKKIVLILILIFSINLSAESYSNEKGNWGKEIREWGRLCDSGETRYCYILGSWYYDGVGVKQNKIKAKELWTKACNDGIMGGCLNLGTLYKNGEGVKKNKKIAKEFYLKACNGGLEDSCEFYKELN